MKIKVTLTEPMLGTKAANEDVFTDFIASKAPDDDKRREELETAEHKEEAGTTVFHRHPDTGELILWDYQVKGFLKEAADIIRQTKMVGKDPKGEEEAAVDTPESPKGGSAKKKAGPWGNAKRKFDNHVFVFPRKISLGVKQPSGVIERPLRVDTMKGPRVSVARSEYVNAGISFVCDITLFGDVVTEKMIKECLSYGLLKGLGQWRNAGNGRFIYEIID